MTKKVIIILFLSAIFFSLFACKSVPENIEEDLPPAEIFQRAQEAVIERNNYKAAMVYYKTFLERYPNDIQNRVIAEYEIAFLYHKMGDDETAVRLFKELLQKYEGENSAVLPQWPRVLAEKLIVKFTEDESDDNSDNPDTQE